MSAITSRLSIPDCSSLTSNNKQKILQVTSKVTAVAAVALAIAAIAAGIAAPLSAVSIMMLAAGAAGATGISLGAYIRANNMLTESTASRPEVFAPLELFAQQRHEDPKPNPLAARASQTPEEEGAVFRRALEEGLQEKGGPYGDPSTAAFIAVEKSSRRRPVAPPQVPEEDGFFQWAAKLQWMERVFGGGGRCNRLARKAAQGQS